jgi:chemotaxis protein methyltransferase CheR
MDAALFDEIRRTIYDICGISIPAGKEMLVRGRLAKRLRALELGDYRAYLDRVRSDPAELSEMVDALTTNKTGFFREAEHFTYLRNTILPRLVERGGPIRIWSAGCSSGEEPYTLALVLRDALGPLEWRRVRILATDISARMMRAVREACYTQAALEPVPPPLLYQYFTCVRREPGPLYQLSDEIRAAIRPARLNLLAPWPMRGPFDLILCRNVMIYFDRPTQQRLVQRFHDLLAPGGHLFVGHSESLTGLEHPFRYLRPAVYARRGAAS